MKPQEITFKADKKHRDKYFSSASFAHPAKMILPLQRWLIEKYSKPGDVILDPMAGQGTLLIACTTGRHVIMVELESKFVQMQRDNWTKIQTLGPEMGYSMGTATILQGDARRLPDVLADAIISSPPYGNRLSDVAVNDGDPQRMGYRQALADVVITSPPYALEDRIRRSDSNPRTINIRESKHIGTGRDFTYGQDNIGNLPYGKLADVIMTSPPYALDDRCRRPTSLKGEKIKKEKAIATTADYSYGKNEAQIGLLPYGSIDAVITSPPYEGSMTGGGNGIDLSKTKRDGDIRHQSLGLLTYGSEYSKSKENIGNLKGESYLSAMLEVYQGCWRVLKPQGLMILVTKNFIRNKQEIRLDLDTIKLCELANFQFVERHYRRLTSQSFWRTIYQQKYPDAPILDKEDILVFKKNGELDG